MRPVEDFGGGFIRERGRKFRREGKCRVSDRIVRSGGGNVTTDSIEVAQCSRRRERRILTYETGCESWNRGQIIRRDSTNKSRNGWRTKTTVGISDKLSLRKAANGKEGRMSRSRRRKMEMPQIIIDRFGTS